jgi:kynureninase
VHILTPAESERRGCQLSIRIAAGAARGKRVFDALSARGVVCDWRSPDIIRVAPVPLYNRFEDARRFAHALAESLRENP